MKAKNYAGVDLFRIPAALMVAANPHRPLFDLEPRGGRPVHLLSRPYSGSLFPDDNRLLCIGAVCEERISGQAPPRPILKTKHAALSGCHPLLFPDQLVCREPSQKRTGIF